MRVRALHGLTVDPDIAYELPEAARKIGVSERHLQRAIRLGLVKTWVFGDRTLIRRGDLEALTEHDIPPLYQLERQAKEKLRDCKGNGRSDSDVA